MMASDASALAVARALRAPLGVQPATAAAAGCGPHKLRRLLLSASNPNCPAARSTL